MVESGEWIFEPIGREGLVALAGACGMEIDAEVLRQLERRRLIRPMTGFDEPRWTAVHLYAVALYFEAVTQVRHPWMSLAKRLSVNEVQARSNKCFEAIEGARAQGGDAVRALRGLGDEVLGLAERHNPLGEFADVLDLDSRRTRSMLAGGGRLYAELRRLARELVELSGAGLEAGRGADEVNTFAEDEPTVLMDRADVEQDSSGEAGEAPRDEAAVGEPVKDRPDRLRRDGSAETSSSEQQGELAPNEAAPREAEPEPTDGKPEADEASLERRVAELNTLRQKYIQAQEWEKLAELYEDGMELFDEPAERQQVFMTLAMLYEVKLSRLELSLERFIDAYLAAPEQRERCAKALDGVRRLGRQKGNVGRYVEWLEEQVEAGARPPDAPGFEPDLTGALAAAGRPDHALSVYADFLSGSPQERLDQDALARLDELAEAAADGDLSGVWRVLVDAELEDGLAVQVALRGARAAADREADQEAIGFYREVVARVPDHPVAFHGLAQLYEDASQWLELYHLHRAGSSASSELERVEELILDHADELTYRIEAAWVSGDKELLGSVASLFIARQRVGEAYAFLNKFVADADDVQAQATAYQLLAEIAVRHLHTPEEAAVHYERALELGGPKASLLKELARVRFDAQDWTDALTAVKALMNAVDGMSGDEAVDWLSMGVRAARHAGREADSSELLTSLKTLAPDHPILADSSG